MLLHLRAIVGFVFVSVILFANATNTTFSGKRFNGGVVDRGSYARLNRLKARSNVHSLDPKTIDNNELVKLLHKAAFQKVDHYSPLAQRMRSFQTQLNRTSYEGNDACVTKPLHIVVFVDSMFFSIFQNWLLYFVRVCGSASVYSPSKSNISLEIVCVDQDMSAKLDFLDLRCSKYSSHFLSNSLPSVSSFRQHVNSGGRYLRDEEQELAFRSSLWVMRMRVIRSMLNENRDILLCDVDALWNNDPFPSISSILSSSDQDAAKVAIVSSQGKWPPEVSDHWGSALCMGFILLRNSEYARSLLTGMLSKWTALEEQGSSSIAQTLKMERKGWVRWDDQYAINMALFEASVAWRPIEGRSQVLPTITSKRSWWSAFAKVPTTDTAPKPLLNASLAYLGKVQAQANTAHLVLLPRTSFVRHCLLHPFHGNMTQKLANRDRVAALLEDDQTKIIHCIGGMRTSGSAINKIKFLKELGLWLLQEQTDLF